MTGGSKIDADCQGNSALAALVASSRVANTAKPAPFRRMELSSYLIVSGIGMLEYPPGCFVLSRIVNSAAGESWRLFCFSRVSLGSAPFPLSQL